MRIHDSDMNHLFFIISFNGILTDESFSDILARKIQSKGAYIQRIPAKKPMTTYKSDFI